MASVLLRVEREADHALAAQALCAVFRHLRCFVCIFRARLIEFQAQCTGGCAKWRLCMRARRRACKVTRRQGAPRGCYRAPARMEIVHFNLLFSAALSQRASTLGGAWRRKTNKMCARWRALCWRRHACRIHHHKVELHFFDGAAAVSKVAERAWSDNNRGTQKTPHPQRAVAHTNTKSSPLCLLNQLDDVATIQSVFHNHFKISSAYA